MRLNSIDPKIAMAMKGLDPNKFEIITHSLYHFKKITGALDGNTKMPTSLSFFQTKTGAVDDDGVATTLEDTNMSDAGKIGTGYKFWGQYVRFLQLPDKADETPALKDFKKDLPQQHIQNDLVKILARGVVDLKVLNQPFLTVAPLMSLPSGIGANFQAPSSIDRNMGSGMVSSGWNVLSNARAIDLWLEGQISFEFKVAFPSGDFPVYNSHRMAFFIDGFLARPRLA